MYERKKFEKLKLIEILDKVSKELKSEIDCYIIGGLAMMFHGTAAMSNLAKCTGSGTTR